MLNPSKMFVRADPSGESIAEMVLLFRDALGADIVHNFRFGACTKQEQIVPEGIFRRHELIPEVIMMGWRSRS